MGADTNWLIDGSSGGAEDGLNPSEASDWGALAIIVLAPRTGVLAGTAGSRPAAAALPDGPTGVAVAPGKAAVWTGALAGTAG
jgi:hypothetical protein